MRPRRPARGCTRRQLLAGAGMGLASVALGAHGTVRAQGEHYGDKATEKALEKQAEAAAEFPRRPITLLVPWPAGGSTDISMRVLAGEAEKQLGQTIIIENKSGAGGTLAMPLLTQAAPDGYTIAQLPQPVFRAPWVQK